MKFPWSNKWSPKKTPPRRSQSLNNLAALEPNQRQKEFGLDAIDRPTELRLGEGPTLKFENGRWTTASAGPNGQNSNVGTEVEQHAVAMELKQVKDELLRSNEENNMLKLKVELLLDMLAEVSESVRNNQSQGIQQNQQQQPGLLNTNTGPLQPGQGLMSPNISQQMSAPMPSSGVLDPNLNINSYNSIVRQPLVWG